MPIKRHHPQIHVEEHEREDRAHTGRRQRGQNRDGVNVALVQHAQHDVHRDDGGQNQPAFVGQRSLESRALCPGKLPWTLGGKSDLALGLLDSRHRLAQRSAPAPRLNEMVTAGNCP